MGQCRPRKISRFLQEFIRRLPGYAWLAQHSQALNLLRITIGGVTTILGEALARHSGPSPFITPDEQFRRQGLALLAGEMTWLEQHQSLRGPVYVTLRALSRKYLSFPGAWGERSSLEALWQCGPTSAADLQEEYSLCGLPRPFAKELANSISRSMTLKLDTHPNPDGYRVIAELVAQFLLEKELIPLPTDHRPDGP